MSKEENIGPKKAELNLLLIQLREIGVSATVPMTSHITQALNEGSRVIEATLPHLSVDDLRHSPANNAANNNDQRRNDFLSKLFS